MADPRMSNNVVVTPAVDGAQENAQEAVPVTMDAVAKAISDAVNKVNNDLSAKLGRLAKAVPSSEPDQPATAIERTLKERLAALEAKEAVAKSRALRMTVKEQLVANGADPLLAEMATAAILESEGDKFAVNEGKYGEFSVVYGDGNACADWAKAWMQTDSGKRIAAGSAAPSLGLKNGKASPPKTVKQVPVSLAHTVSSEDLRSGRVEIVT